MTDPLIVGCMHEEGHEAAAMTDLLKILSGEQAEGTILIA